MQVLKHNDLTKAAAVIKNGGIIVYPTDTVWGIGCDAANYDAVKRVIKIKRKPEDAKLIQLFPNIRAVKKIFNISVTEEKLLNAKRTTVIIDNTAVRVIKTGWLNKLLKKCGVPLVSTSANIHGEKTVISWRQAVDIFGSSADAVIRGGKNYGRLPSTVVQCKDNNVKIIRQGAGSISIK